MSWRNLDKTGNCPPPKILKSSWNTDGLYIYFFSQYNSDYFGQMKSGNAQTWSAKGLKSIYM
jgi:hypothetical protein